ncbi:GAF domain-containing protein [Citricoccus sp.]|uniref:GAF domain-containing protein n=1 Tax=Citricoccus sp. TaxID=1978372 RepID=UPI00261A5EC6|nr:GAF domain-containing protein [Citricoccus sp.]HRO28875.1 GAF domain-containing protein [Citricoccus sp.]
MVQSWRRSLAVRARIDASAAPAVLADDDLRHARSEHPLAGVLAVVRRLLVQPATDAGLIVALGNAAGQLLWVEGDPAAARRAEVMGFVPGADWSETSVGTSAPGAALATGRPMQVSRAEHFHPVVHPWSCSAVPLRDPSDGSILGVLDLTGGDEAVSPLALPLLAAAASAVELTWQRTGAGRAAGSTVVVPGRAAREAGPTARTAASGGTASTGGVDPGPGAPAHGDAGRDLLLRVTGVLPARLGRDGAALREVSGRHAEILTLLDWHAPGLDGAALEDMLYGRRGQDVTLRAELHRLRRMLAGCAEGGTGPSTPGPAPGTGPAGDAPDAGRIGLDSRPYRISGPLRTDAGLARDALRRGDLDAALRCAVGMVLPRSEAPGIVEIRRELHADLREAVLQDAGLEQLWAYLGRPEAAGDLDLWSTALRMLPADSPRRALAVSTIERITAGG